MILLKLLIVILPWFLKRILLVRIFGYEISKSAYIGISWVFPGKLVMCNNSRVGHLNVIVNLDLLKMGSYSIIERQNWITGYSKHNTSHFSYNLFRLSEFHIGDHSAITKKHHIDCTDRIMIGKFTTIAGYSSQMLTHSISIYESRQECLPINIGDYCFVSTDCVLLGGSLLPDYSVLGAKSLLNKPFAETFSLYGGVPAKLVTKLPSDSKYFSRSEGFIF